MVNYGIFCPHKSVWKRVCAAIMFTFVTLCVFLVRRVPYHLLLFQVPFTRYQSCACFHPDLFNIVPGGPEFQ